MKPQLLALLIFVSQFCFSQSDTTWFDKSWNKTTKAKAYYFRPAPESLGTGFYIRDYYLNGVMQFEGWSYTQTGEEWDGVVKYYRSNGKIESSGDYKSRVLCGAMTQYDPSGNPIDQSMEDQNNGIKYNYYPNGSIEYFISYKSGKRNGVVKKFFPNGRLEEEYNYVNDSLEGDVYRFYEDSTINIRAHFRGNKKDGEWIEYFRNGKTDHKTFFKNGLENGLRCDYDITGRVLTTDTYLNGKKTGPHRRYFSDGHIREEGNFTDGEESGIWRVYDPKGNVIKEVPSKYPAELDVYKRTVLHMPVFERDSGTITYKPSFLNDSGGISYMLQYPNGKKRWGGALANYKQEGRWLYYDKEGKVRAEQYFTKGVHDGWERYYDSAGRLFLEMNFTEGKLDGVLTEYNYALSEPIKHYFLDGAEIAEEHEYERKKEKRDMSNNIAEPVVQSMPMMEEENKVQAKLKETSVPVVAYDDKIRMDTVSNSNGVLRLTKILPRKSRDKRFPEIKEMILNLEITRDGLYVLDRYKDYKPGENEVILFYEDNTGDVVSWQQMEFRIGKNIEAALKSKQLEISELVDLYQRQIYRGPVINTQVAIFKLGREIK